MAKHTSTYSCNIKLVLDARRWLGGLVAQWITRLTTDQKIPGSNPGELDFLYHFIYMWLLNKTLTLPKNSGNTFFLTL